MYLTEQEAYSLCQDCKMATRVVLTNTSRSTSRKPSNSNKADLSIDRHTYQSLGSLEINKTIIDRYDNGELTPEYMKFLDDMQKLSDGNTDVDMKSFDEYLGSLGDIEEYKYSKDYVNIPEWIDITGQDSYRNVATFTGFVNGQQVIDKNVVYTDTNGITYNVVHKTGE